MISLDYRDSRPLYQQVKDSLRRMMLTGLLSPEDKLPQLALSGAMLLPFVAIPCILIAVLLKAPAPEKASLLMRK